MEDNTISEKNQSEAEIRDESVSEEIREESKSGEEEPEVKEKDTSAEEHVVLTKDEHNELRKKAEERDSLLDKLLRTRAEFQNYQKRMRKEHEMTAQYAIQDLVLDLFPELDNFERAVKLAETSGDIDKFVEGIKLIEDQFLKVLGKYGVKPIETVGKPFDPNLHEAVFEEENNELPHHTIIEELQRGLFLKERVVRHSKVKVSKNSAKEKISDKDEGDASDSQ